jgi:ankyrin repeat protein
LYQGYTPLLYASCAGDLKMVAFLLSAGANPNIPSHVRFSTIPLFDVSYFTVQRYLHTALHMACYQGHVEVAQLLINSDADVTARDYVSSPGAL